jgi:hypothetical protein
MKLPKELEGKARITTHGNIRYFECIDCGEPKENDQQRYERCYSCGAKNRDSQYNQREGFRICKKCDEEKELNRDNFQFLKGKDILSGTCRACMNERQLERKRNWTPEQIERNKAVAKEWRNKNEVVERRRTNTRKRMKKPEYRLRHNVSNTIRRALQRNQGGKLGGSILNHLPYSIVELKEHIESQFEAGMSWENLGIGEGMWNIDHIYPQSKLPYDTLEHPNFQKCWALSNLRPMWSLDNLRKNNKIITELL